MARADAPPPPIVRKQRGQLVPVTAWDAAGLDEYADQTEFDLRPRTRRSLPQHRLYWQALSKAVEATGRWPTPEALHTALKVRLGRFEPIFDLKGNVCGMKPDSTAFDKMGHREFTAYAEQAYAALSEALGYDCLAFMEEAV